jgi:DNA-binding HxlR family transcriptional regulator
MDSPSASGHRPPPTEAGGDDPDSDIPGSEGSLAWTIATQEVVAILGRKWVISVVRELASGTKRRFQLTHAIKGVAPKVLTETLRFLERDGVVERVLHDEGHGSKSIGYQLTDLGQSLANPLTAIYRWGREHLDDVHRSRHETDALWAEEVVLPGARDTLEVPEIPLK